MTHSGRRFFRKAFAACVPARDEEEKHEEVSTYTFQSQVSLMNKEPETNEKSVRFRWSVGCDHPPNAKKWTCKLVLRE